MIQKLYAAKMNESVSEFQLKKIQKGEKKLMIDKHICKHNLDRHLRGELHNFWQHQIPLHHGAQSHFTL